MKYLKRRFDELSNANRWALLLLLFFILAIAVYLPRLDFGQLSSPNILEKVTFFIPIFLLVGSLISAGLIWFKHSAAGGWLLIAIVQITMIATTMMAEGYGFAAFVIALILSLAIGSLTLSSKRVVLVSMLTLLTAMAVLLIDTFWPFARLGSSAENKNFINIIVATLLVLFFLVVAFRFRTLPLRLKMVLGFLIAAVVPVTIIGFTTNFLTRQALVKNADASLVASSSQMASVIDTFIFSNLDAVRLEAQQPDFAAYLEMPAEQRAGSEQEKEVYALLEIFRNRDPLLIDSYGILDKNGIDVANTTAGDIGTGKSDRDYFIETMRTGLPYMSTVEMSPILKSYVIFTGAPIRNDAGEIIGVLRSRYDANVLQQRVVQNSSLGGDTIIMLVDETSRVLANSLDASKLFKVIIPLDNRLLGEYRAKRLLSDAPPNDLMAQNPDLVAGLKNAGSQVTFSGDLFGEDHLSIEQAGAVRLKNRPWYMVVAKSEAIVLAPIDQQTRTIMLTGIIVSIMAIVFAMIFAQILTNPIMRLIDFTNQVAEGNLNVQAPVTTTDEIGVLSKTFNLMASQLNTMVNSLEQRVTDRTKALSTSAEVSRRLSTILDQNQLVKEVVEQLQSSFNYYHVHIYLFDERHENLILAGGTGEAGQTMMARGHKILKNRGLVGKAAETGLPILVEDVSVAPGWLHNPLLPDTKSELAIPISIADTVLGVLDVQQDSVGGLKAEDAELLQSISNQVAIALQNARSYAQTQRRANREALITAIGQRIQRAVTMDEALMIAAREIGRALETETVVSLEPVPAGNALENES